MQFHIKKVLSLTTEQKTVDTVIKKMRWFREQRNDGGSCVLPILLMLMLKTVGKETITFLFAFKMGGGGAMAPMAPLGYFPAGSAERK